MKRPVTRPKPVYVPTRLEGNRTIQNETVLYIGFNRVFPDQEVISCTATCDLTGGIDWKINHRVGPNYRTFDISDPAEDLDPRYYDAWLYAHAQALAILKHPHAVRPWPRGLRKPTLEAMRRGINDIIDAYSLKGEMTADEALDIVLDGKAGLS